MTIANAKLRANDPVFQAMSKQFEKLLDNAADSYNEANYVLKLARGEKINGRNKDFSQLDIDNFLCNIQETAEEIIRKVVELKNSKSFNKEL